MKRVLIRCGWLVTLDPDDRRLQGRRASVQRQPDRGRGPQPRRDRRRDDRRHRQDRHAGPGQRAHAHLGNGAARHRRGVDVGRLFQAHAPQSRDALQARGQLPRQPDRRAGPDRRRRHHPGRLVPQHHHARARRARGRRPRSTAASARCSRTAPPSRSAAESAHAVHPRAASARAHRGAAQGPAGERRRPRHARHGDPRSRLGRLGGGRARHPHGARVRPGVVVAHAAARGLRRARRLSRAWPRRGCSGPTTISCMARATTRPISAWSSTTARR